jgi:glycosyltransferase involved in cell wall biosynthesis
MSLTGSSSRRFAIRPHYDDAWMTRPHDARERRPAGDTRLRVLTLGRDIGTCFGGAERIAFEIVSRLDPERFARYLCITHARPPERLAANERDLAELEGAGVEVLRLERRSLRSNVAWARLYRLLREDSIDILHAHMPRASLPGTIIGRFARVPVIVSHEHTWSFEGRPVRRFLDRNVLARGGDLMLAVSEADRKRMVDIERIPPDQIRILPNGIPALPEDGRDVRGELGVPPEVGLIGSIGRLYPQKGYDNLIRAIAQLKREHPDPIRCLIVGHGPEEPALRALICDLDVEEEVRLIGRRDDVPDVIRALDLAVLPSRYEGSPLAVIEYMACGAPIVATAVGGIPEMIHDGRHGLLVEPDDQGALVAAMRRLLEDRKLATRLGEAARARQRANFDLDVVVGQLEEIYEELIARKRSRTLRDTVHA